MISAVMNTRNAASTLEAALRSLRPWVDEIVVVDMDSDDDTVAISHRYGARVLRHEPMGYADPARQFAIDHSQHEWIMVLDADEVVPHTLARRLQDIVRSDDYDVVVIPRANHLFGARAAHGVFAPLVDRHPRFFRRGCLHMTGDVHAFEHVGEQARVLVLPPDDELCFQHYSHLDAEDFLGKTNKYTTLAAAARVDRGEVGARPVRAFLRAFGRCYLRERGVLDGWRGRQTALLYAFDRMLTELKVRELQRTGGRTAVCSTYAQLTQVVLEDWVEPS